MKKILICSGIIFMFFYCNDKIDIHKHYCFENDGISFKLLVDEYEYYAYSKNENPEILVYGEISVQNIADTTLRFLFGEIEMEFLDYTDNAMVNNIGFNPCVQEIYQDQERNFHLLWVIKAPLTINDVEQHRIKIKYRSEYLELIAKQDID